MTVALAARIVLPLAAVAGNGAQAYAAESLTDQELVARKVPAVVSISVLRAASPATGTTVASTAGSAEHAAAPLGHSFLSSGFIIDPSGIIVTNRHVTEDATYILVTLRSGPSARGASHEVACCPGDVALIKVIPDITGALNMSKAEGVIVGGTKRGGDASG